MPKYIVTNFAYGTGPYLRSTDLAIAFNNEIEKAGHERFKIIVPLVYGEKQKTIMAQENLLSDEIIFDEGLGKILEKVFYGNEGYEDYLKKWANNFQSASREAKSYLSGKYSSDIALEIGRVPRLLYGVAPAYSSAFGYLSRVFQEASKADDIKIDKELLEKAAKIADCVEKEQRMRRVGYPGLFAPEEELVPPLSFVPKPDNAEIEKGVFVTKTGIPGLERVYKDIEKIGLKIYTNKDHHPNLISNKNILLHFARSGWGSVWPSLVAEKPIILPQYDPADDPEIYLNNKLIEKLGIGIVYRGESLDELLKKSEEVKKNQQKFKKEIMDRWGTLDGIKYCAKVFAKDFLDR